MMIWNFVALGANTITIFTVYFECAFRLRALEEEAPWIYAFEVILVLEVLLSFFKAFPSTDSERGWVCQVLGVCGLCKPAKNTVRKKKSIKKELDVSGWNTTFSKIAIRYLSGSFLIDFLSVVPFFIGKLTSRESHYKLALKAPLMQVFAYLRLLRIT